MNFQNLPRTNKVVKRVFIPKRGAFSFFDYQQIEPRLFAFYCAKGLGDERPANWFREGRDFYKEIAGQVYEKSADLITDEERQQGKVWFLMSLYTAGPKKLAAETGMTYKDAKAFYLQFHERLPQIKSLSNPPPQSPGGWRSYEPGLIERTLKRRDHIKTPWGRHLHPEQWGEHKMLNKLIQGSAADLMKLALVSVGRWQRDPARPYQGALASRMVLTVHDEIVFDGPPDEVDALHDAIPTLMGSDIIEAVVPLGVDHEVSVTNMADKIGYDEWKETA